MKHFFLSLFSILFLLKVEAQNILISSPSAEEKQLSTFAADQFGNLYLAQGNNLKKVDDNNKTIARFSNPINGDITSVDLLDPMYPLVFFNDFNRISFLDNRLNERESTDLINLRFSDPELVCNGGNNLLFIYDQATDKISRYDHQEQRTLNQTLNITQLLKKENTPLALQADFEGVYLYTSELGLVIFDNVLAYRKTLPITNAIDVVKKNKKYYFLYETKIEVYSPSGEKINDLFHDIKTPLKLSVLNENAYLIQASNKIYTLQLAGHK